VWLSTSSAVGYLDGDRFVAVSGLLVSPTRGIVEDGRGVWFASTPSGLRRVSADGRRIAEIPWAKLNRQEVPSAVAASPARNGIWLGFPQGGLIDVVDGEVRASITSRDGLTEGTVRHLRLDGDGVLWAATDGGVSRLKDGRVTALRGRNGLPCDGALWTFEDESKALWLATRCGLVRITGA